MANIYETYKILQKKNHGSYWEERILAELQYLMERYPDLSAKDLELLEQAMGMLMEDCLGYDQIQVQTAKAAEQLLLPLSDMAKQLTILCAAHAHIDMNWMWGYQETVAVTLDTVRTMLTLMKEYPDFIFSQSQASVYHILEEYAPELLEQVRQRVQEGRWEVTASTWVENDKNMPSGESMARHLLYTKRYLSNLLNIEEASLNLDFEPDTFGHSANLPEILTRGGVTRYYHCRGYEGENIYRWRGSSGAEVIVYREPKWYNGESGSGICQGVPEFCRKYKINQILFVYGVGDHGGGPTRRDLDRLVDMGSWPLFPVIRFGTYREYYDYLEGRRECFPVVDQELNYVFTGCYTSQSRIKMANRIGEARLTEAEILESMAKAEIPGHQNPGSLEEAWRKILFNQFHDIIPGSGMVETREHAMGEFQNAMARAGANGVAAMDAICSHLVDSGAETRCQDTAMGAGVGSGTDYASGFCFSRSEQGCGPVRYLALFNVTQEVRTDPAELTLWDWPEDAEDTRVTDMEGREYPFQILEQGKGYWSHTYCRLLVWMPVPAVGYAICRVTSKEAGHVPEPVFLYSDQPRVDEIADESICLENDKVKAVFEPSTMKCISFVRKSDERTLIVSDRPACGLLLITEETSHGMSAWRVGRTSAVTDLNEACRVQPCHVQTEGLRKELEYEILGENLKVRVKIHLDEGSEFLHYCLNTEWKLLGNKENGIPQLRFQVPCGYKVENYRYAIPFGTIDREPLAQDVPAVGLGCALPEAGGSALCMMSDCKYGFRGTREGFSLNLLRGSYYPDPYPELGVHVMRIAVGACDTDKQNLMLMAERYMHPVMVRSCSAKPLQGKASRSFLEVKGAVLSAVKEAEDGKGCIIRVYNPLGEEQTMHLSLPGNKFEVFLCDILENPIEPVEVSEGERMEYTLRKCEVATFRMVRD